MLEGVYSREGYIGEGERLKACKRIGGQVQRKTEYRSKETGGREGIKSKRG